MRKEDCIFCKIINGDIPSNTIYENSDFKVIMDASPATKGHVLILPKEHFKDIYDIDAETAGKLFQLASVVARALKEALHCDGLNILQNIYIRISTQKLCAQDGIIENQLCTTVFDPRIPYIVRVLALFFLLNCSVFHVLLLSCV